MIFLVASPPSRAAWIEIRCEIISIRPRRGRRLHGRRGLKYLAVAVGADALCRRLHGRRGLKCIKKLRSARFTRRRLHGRRGLKSPMFAGILITRPSPPSRAAWIEIRPQLLTSTAMLSPPSRAAWIEMTMSVWRPCRRESPPSRAAWIEMACLRARSALGRVAAFTGGVD